MHCRHHPTCPGCPLAGLPYPEQLVKKAHRLQAALQLYPHLGLPAPSAPVGSDHTEGYRHRLKLPVAQSARLPAIGLYSRDGSRVLDTPDCPVLVPALRAALLRLQPWLTGHSEVHSVDLRCSHATGKMQLVLACREGELRGGRGAAASIRSLIPEITSIAVSRADRERKRVMGAQPRLIAGDPTLDERIGQTAYRLFPGAFFQTDPGQATRLHLLVRNAVGNARTVLDLYAGVGAYGLMLAAGRRQVVCIEEVPQAAAAARAMAPKNVDVINATVEEWEKRGITARFDVAVLNPARRGSSPAVLATIARVAERLVYVSCGPETLARDLDILAASGMRAREIQPIDLFPQTPEVETVVVLERASPLRNWVGPGGQAASPWASENGGISGAVGQPTTVLMLVVGDPEPEGRFGPAAFRTVGHYAGHALIRVQTRQSPMQLLAGAARAGFPVAGTDPRTAAFFAEKGGLLRPFVHVEQAGANHAPLHGDLAQCLTSLGRDTKGGRTAPSAPRSPSPTGRRGGNRRPP